MCGHCAANGADWDTIALAHCNKNEKTAEILISEIRARLDWIGINSLANSKDKEMAGQVERNGVRLLDYGCGTGLISRALAPYITQAVGIDISPNMVHEYNTWANTQSTTPKLSAFTGNFLDPADPSLAAFSGQEFQGFDLAVVGLVFHQLNDPILAVTKLVERLKTGGVLLIIDFPTDEKPSEQDHGGGFWRKHGHGRGDTTSKRGNQNGLGEEGMKGIFESAGVGMNFGFEVIVKDAVFDTGKHSMTSDVFMARGIKA